MSMQTILKLIKSNLTSGESSEGFAVTLTFATPDRNDFVGAAKIDFYNGETYLLTAENVDRGEVKYSAVNLDQVTDISCAALERAWGNR